MYELAWSTTLRTSDDKESIYDSPPTSPTTYSRLAHAELLRLRSFNDRKSNSDSIIAPMLLSCGWFFSSTLLSNADHKRISRGWDWWFGNPSLSKLLLRHRKPANSLRSIFSITSLIFFKALEQKKTNWGNVCDRPTCSALLLRKLDHRFIWIAFYFCRNSVFSFSMMLSMLPTSLDAGAHTLTQRKRRSKLE
jgi:hypothetical protein